MEDLLSNISFSPENLDDKAFEEAETTPVEEQKDEDDETKQEVDEQPKDDEETQAPSDTDNNDDDKVDNEDSDDEDEDDDEPSLIEQLRQEYEIEGEFENTPEGLREFTRSVVEKRSQEGAQRQMEKYFETYPDVAEYIQMRRSGMSVEDVYESVKGLQLPDNVVKDNDEQQKVIQRTYYQRKGLSESRIKRLIEVAENDGTLYEESKEFLKEMKEEDQLIRQERQQQLEQQEQQQKEQITKYWEDVGNTIKKGEIMNFRIPENEKDKFFNYIARAVDKDGNTQEMLDRKEMSIEQQLALRWLYYKKFNLGEYIRNKAKGESLNKLLKNKERSNNRMKGGNNRDSSVGLDHLKEVQF